MVVAVRIWSYTKKILLRVVLVSRVSAECQPPSGETRQVEAALDRPVLLERHGAPDVERAFAIDQSAIEVADTECESAARGETAELRMHAIAPEGRQDTRFDGVERALEAVHLVRRERFLFFVARALQ